MLCPYCFCLKDEAPALLGEGPCSPPHCADPVCSNKCPECSDWFQAIEPEEADSTAPKESTKGSLSRVRGATPSPSGPLSNTPEGDTFI